VTAATVEPVGPELLARDELDLLVVEVDVPLAPRASLLTRLSLGG
jgi:hypothetical protein